MKKKILAAIGLTVLAASVHAEPASAEAIEQLLAMTKAEALLDTMYANADQMMRQSMRQSVGNRTLTAQQQRALDEMPAKFVAIMRQELNWATLKPMYVRIYQESFEQEEIAGLIAFYGTPAGQALITKMPVVMQKSMSIVQDQMRTLIPRMGQVVEQSMKEAGIPRP